MNRITSYLKTIYQYMEIKLFFKVFVTAVFAFFLLALCAPKEKTSPVPVRTGENGKLIYKKDTRGNRIPDFSYCGYKASEVPIPNVAIKIVVPVKNGDDTERIQAAIDYVSSLPIQEDGFRGAVLLEKGTYKLSGRLKIAKTGVVIRGSGFNDSGTTVIADGIDRETLIKIKGTSLEQTGDEILTADDYVPVNAKQFSVSDNNNLHPGDRIFIRRPSTQEWIDELQMNEFGGESGWLGWKPGDRDIVWDREIVGVYGNQITIDAPITTALDKKFGGGYISKYEWGNRIQNIGIENLNLKSSYNPQNLKDEEHCWMAISMENVKDAWVRQVTFTNFAGSAVAVYESASRVTVEDCKSFEPISEIAEFRRNTFYTSGQQTLFQRLYSEYGYHDFGVGFCSAGPNAFVQCESYLSSNFSGAVDSWASGVLFDIVNIDGHCLSFKNRGQDGYGAGWTAANSMLWQCSAAKTYCPKPPTAQNWAFGVWSQFDGDGYWYEPNSHVKPRSLFYAQLTDRIGKDAIPEKPVMVISTNPTSSPTVELAAELAEELLEAPQTLLEFIDENIEENPVSVEKANAITLDKLDFGQKKEIIETNPMTVQNGWLVRDGEVMTGVRWDVPWWSGNLRPRGLRRARSAITRYVPGREGLGYTDDLDEVTNWMVATNVVGIEQNYGLWYDRRRDDHERVRRMNGEAWAPFYELPFARTGIDQAWDGLSKYDLTKYNPWYWGRLKKFANLADQKGLVLIHQNYFQHNILEAGAHWVDSPWRTVNNINNTGFPEPPPFAGDKRIFVADHFYDITHPVRRELHRLYIRKCLDNFKDNSSVIQLTSAEYTGPLHFVQFWIDVIKEWQEETGENAMIGLRATKDVQDSILADPNRSQIVDVIDIRYWSSRDDGSLYAPKGGQNLAPRQHARLVKKGKRSFESVYNDVFYYRKKIPKKSVIYSFDQSPNLSWAVFMAGGSLANIPKIKVDGFLKSASSMNVVDSNKDGVWMLQNNVGESIQYSTGNTSINIDLDNYKGVFNVIQLNPHDGVLINEEKVEGGKSLELNLKTEQDVIIWTTNNK